MEPRLCNGRLATGDGGGWGLWKSAGRRTHLASGRDGEHASRSGGSEQRWNGEAHLGDCGELRGVLLKSGCWRPDNKSQRHCSRAHADRDCVRTWDAGARATCATKRARRGGLREQRTPALPGPAMVGEKCSADPPPSPWDPDGDLKAKKTRGCCLQKHSVITPQQWGSRNSATLSASDAETRQPTHGAPPRNSVGAKTSQTTSPPGPENLHQSSRRVWGPSWTRKTASDAAPFLPRQPPAGGVACAHATGTVKKAGAAGTKQMRQATDTRPMASLPLLCGRPGIRDGS